LGQIARTASRPPRLVLGVGIGVGEEDATASQPCGQQRLRAPRAHGVEIDGLRTCRRPAPLGHLQAQIARHHRLEIAAQAPGAGPVAAAHFQHVAQALGGDDADPRALALQQRVGARGGAVHHGRDARKVARPLRDAVEKAARLVGPRGRHLGDLGRAPVASSSTKTSVKVPPTSTPIIRLMRASRQRAIGGAAASGLR
jgi:hypothetical protein